MSVRLIGVSVFPYTQHDADVQQRCIRDGEVDRSFVIGGQHFGQPLRGAVGEPHRRLAARQVDHAHILPEHAAQAR